MKREERLKWIERGYKDPVAAYTQQVNGAAARGIEFRLTFEQWWWLWEPHYENRGNKKGQMCMCRLHDKGAYEVGNVRIDRLKANIAEAAMLQRSKKAASAYQPSRDRYRPTPAGNGHWMWRNPFAEYNEDLLDKAD
jgi:hypothetical protein